MPVYATNVELALQQQQVIIAVERVVVVMREHRERGDGVELGGEKEVASLQLLLLGLQRQEWGGMQGEGGCLPARVGEEGLSISVGKGCFCRYQ